MLKLIPGATPAAPQPTPESQTGEIEDILYADNDEYGPDEQLRLEDYHATAKKLAALLVRSRRDAVKAFAQELASSNNWRVTLENKLAELSRLEGE